MKMNSCSIDHQITKITHNTETLNLAIKIFETDQDKKHLEIFLNNLEVSDLLIVQKSDLEQLQVRERFAELCKNLAQNLLKFPRD